jgi:hypothetical protein
VIRCDSQYNRNSKEIKCYVKFTAQKFEESNRIIILMLMNIVNFHNVVVNSGDRSPAAHTPFLTEPLRLPAFTPAVVMEPVAR